MVALWWPEATRRHRYMVAPRIPTGVLKDVHTLGIYIPLFPILNT